MKRSNGKVYFMLTTRNPKTKAEDFEDGLTFRAGQVSLIGSRNGKTPLHSSWWYGTDYLEDPCLVDNIDELIEELLPHQEEFKSVLRKNSGMTARLVVVLNQSDKDGTACLHFRPKGIAFLAALEAEIDCDVYVVNG